VTHSRRSVGYLLVAVLVVTGCLLFAFQRQRSEAVQAGNRTDSAVTALTAMLDQETGLRGFLYTGREEFLQPFFAGQADYESARRAVLTAAGQDRRSLSLAASQDAAARSWQAYAEGAITARRQGGPVASSAPSVTQAVLGKQQMDRFRDVNTQLRVRLDERRDATLRASGELATAIVVLLGALFALVGLLLMERSARRAVARSELELDYRARQREFSDLVQAVDSEAEAHRLVQRHLERAVPGARAGVLIRNNSDNRLQATTIPAADSVLRDSLPDAEPRACLAIRLGRSHQDGSDHQELLSCAVCSRVPGTATCEPLLVSGKVIGSVLLERCEPLTEPERRALHDTVSQAAPVLANLKTIAIAESRASTDALTGLPNPITASFGIASIPYHAGGAELLLRRADRACYLAKDRGRNRVQVAVSDEAAQLEQEPSGPADRRAAGRTRYSMPLSPSNRSTGRAASATAAATAVGTEGSNTDGTM
jgi:CHASE3 domain sensor protein